MALSLGKKLKKFNKEIKVKVLKNISDENIYIQVFWILIYIISIACSSYYIVGVYVKWQIDPDISVNIQTASTHDVPFPAITFCSPYVISDEYVNFTDFLMRINRHNDLPQYSDNQQRLLNVMMEVCPQANGHNMMKFKYEPFILQIMNLTLSARKHLHGYCGLGTTSYDCDKMFNIVPTDKGLCYSFNMQGYNTIFNKGVLSDDSNFYRRKKIAKSLNLSNNLYNQTVDDDNETIHWTMQHGYMSDEINMIPYRASTLMLRFLQGFLNENFFKCFGNFFHVSIHSPSEIPNPYSVHTFAEISKLTFINFVVNSIRRSKSMQNYSPEIRKCFFEGEKLLKFFKSYTKAHCDFECLTNYTLKTCGCVRFYMPRSPTTRVCGLPDSTCTSLALSSIKTYKVRNNGIKSCNCLPPCNEIRYSIDEIVTQPIQDFNPAVIILNKLKLKGITSIDVSVLNYDVEELEYFTAYNLQNFIADVGGFFGIFIGFSFLSLTKFIRKCIKYFKRNIRIH